MVQTQTQTQLSPVLTASGCRYQGSLYTLRFADRFVDTRDGRGGIHSPLSSGTFPNGKTTRFSQPFRAPGRSGQLVPAEATAVQGTITVTNATGDGWLGVLPGDVDPGVTDGHPLEASMLLFQKGVSISNRFTCPLSSDGDIQIELYNPPGTEPLTADVVIDVDGFYISCDLAYSKPAYSSGYYTEPTTNPPTPLCERRAVDHNWGTYWESNLSTGAWLYVDLGNCFTIDQVIAKWGWDTRFGSFAQSAIEVSSDANSWTSVATTVVTPDTNGKEQILRFPATTARYVRLFATQWNGGWGFIASLEVYQPF